MPAPNVATMTIYGDPILIFSRLTAAPILPLVVLDCPLDRLRAMTQVGEALSKYIEKKMDEYGQAKAMPQHASGHNDLTPSFHAPGCWLKSSMGGNYPQGIRGSICKVACITYNASAIRGCLQ